MTLPEEQARQNIDRLLAAAGWAHALVSGDRDLLALAGALRLGAVLSVDAFCRQYLAG